VGSAILPRVGPDRRLARLVGLDVATTTAATVMLLVVHRVVLASGYVLLLAAMVAAAGTVMAAGYVALRRGRARAAVAHVAIANYLIALGATAIAPFAMPVLLIATMLPAVLAVPYVTRAELRLYVLGSFVAAIGVAALGSLQDVTRFSAALPEWIAPGVVVVFTPFMAAMVATIALTNGTVLDDAVRLLVDTNRQLVDTQSTLAENVDELRASRARVVAAADQERRRIERDLHDGSQQALLNAAVRLAVIREEAGEVDPALAAALGAVRDDLHQAIGQLRDLAHGLYPAALVDGGLAAALQHAVGRLPATVTFDVRAAGRYPPEVESAVYFCCTEALHNACKHGGAGANIRLSVMAADSELTFEVDDDGRGFDPSCPGPGVGFDNMTDRLGAVAGRLEVTSSIGAGTRVRGIVPVEPIRAAEPAVLVHRTVAATVAIA
jgi:signal transduction histidine kinase